MQSARRYTTLPTFFATQPVLDALNLSNSSPFAFASMEDVQHFNAVFTDDCCVLIALTALYCLADAAENARLDSDTYQRLAAAVLLYGATNAAAVALVAGVGLATDAADAAPSPSAAYVAVILLASVPAAAAGASAIVKYGGGFGAAVERTVEDVKAAAALRGGVRDSSDAGGYLELFYKYSFWVDLIVCGAFLLSPVSPIAAVNEYTPSAIYIGHIFELGGVFMLTPVSLVLLDAARRGRLGGSTFKKLNISTAAAIACIVGSTLVTFMADFRLAPDVESSPGGGLYNLYGAVAVSVPYIAVYLYQGLFAKK